MHECLLQRKCVKGNGLHVAFLRGGRGGGSDKGDGNGPSCLVCVENGDGLPQKTRQSVLCERVKKGSNVCVGEVCGELLLHEFWPVRIHIMRHQTSDTKQEAQVQRTISEKFHSINRFRHTVSGGNPLPLSMM